MRSVFANSITIALEMGGLGGVGFLDMWYARMLEMQPEFFENIAAFMRQLDHQAIRPWLEGMGDVFDIHGRTWGTRLGDGLASQIPYIQSVADQISAIFANLSATVTSGLDASMPAVPTVPAGVSGSGEMTGKGGTTQYFNLQAGTNEADARRMMQIAREEAQGAVDQYADRTSILNGARQAGLTLS
jgi:hypothetical protein